VIVIRLFLYVLITLAAKKYFQFIILQYPAKEKYSSFPHQCAKLYFPHVKAVRWTNFKCGKTTFRTC